MVDSKLAKEERKPIAQWSKILQCTWTNGDMEGVRLVSGALWDHYIAKAKSYCVQA